VDTTRFRPHSKRNDHQGQIIGWSGTSGNLRLLEALDCELAAVLERFQGAHLRVICDRAPNFNRVPASRVEFIHWSPETEVDALRDLSVGLMPLTDTEWSRGKCAFKMLTYMACGVPAVVSPIGMNAELLAEAEVGFGATTTDDWIEAISILLKDGSLAATLGENGRKQVETAYSVNVIAPRLAAIMKEIAGC
jgi:glycosyltransferase involved in cell wall biosynthesis